MHLNILFEILVPVHKKTVHKKTIIETTKANGIEPYKYLKYLFEKFPYVNNTEDIYNLLPMNIDKAELHK